MIRDLTSPGLSCYIFYIQYSFNLQHHSKLPVRFLRSYYLRSQYLVRQLKLLPEILDRRLLILLRRIPLPLHRQVPHFGLRLQHLPRPQTTFPLLDPVLVVVLLRHPLLRRHCHLRLLRVENLYLLLLLLLPHWLVILLLLRNPLALLRPIVLVVHLVAALLHCVLQGSFQSPPLLPESATSGTRSRASPRI